MRWVLFIRLTFKRFPNRGNVLVRYCCSKTYLFHGCIRVQNQTLKTPTKWFWLKSETSRNVLADDEQSVKRVKQLSVRLHELRWIDENSKRNSVIKWVQLQIVFLVLMQQTFRLARLLVLSSSPSSPVHHCRLPYLVFDASNLTTMSFFFHRECKQNRCESLNTAVPLTRNIPHLMIVLKIKQYFLIAIDAQHIPIWLWNPWWYKTRTALKTTTKKKKITSF